MKHLALDLWDDLRAKRLWPLAAALLVGLIAIPLFVMKPAEEPAPAAARPDARQAQATPALALGDQSSQESSNLGVFGKKDPFRPPGAALEPSSIEGAASGSVAGASALPPIGGGSGPIGGGSGPLGGSPAPAAGLPGPSGGKGSAPAAPGPAPPPRRVRSKRVAYTYVADVTFSRNGRARRIRRLDRLDMLPSRESPLLIFLGVTADGDDAVFLVDSTLGAEGEGRCAPRASDCATLSIGAGSEHAFTDQEGNHFALRLNEIRKVRVGRASSSSRRRPRARTATGRSRRFVPPVLADLITVARPDRRHSSRADRDR